MQQAIHIFKKDARYLRWEIALLLAAVSWNVWTEVHSPGGGLGGVLIFLLAFVITGRVVQSEALPGERQSWLTRPYSWKSLLGAKCLFLAVFVLAPLMASDIVLVKHGGFAVTDYLPGLIGEQVVRIAVIGAPALVLAAITRTVAGQIFVGLGMYLAMAAGLMIANSSGMYRVENWPALDWVHNFISAAVVLIASAGIVWWQYSRRRTFAARIAAGCGAAAVCLLGTLPVSAAIKIENRVQKSLADPSAIQVTLDPPPASAKPGSLPYAVWMRLPLTIRGLPDGVRMWADQIQLIRWHNGGGIGFQMVDWIAVDHSHAEIVVKENRLREYMVDGSGIEGSGTRLTGRALITLAANAHKEPLNWDAQTAFVPGLGRCQGRTPLVCYSPFRDTRYIASVPGEVYLPSYLPFPATLNVDPVQPYFFHGDFGPVPSELTLEEPVAHFFLNFEFDGSTFSDYFVEPVTGPKSGTP